MRNSNDRATLNVCPTNVSRGSQFFFCSLHCIMYVVSCVALVSFLLRLFSNLDICLNTTHNLWGQCKRKNRDLNPNRELYICNSIYWQNFEISKWPKLWNSRFWMWIRLRVISEWKIIMTYGLCFSSPYTPISFCCCCCWCLIQSLYEAYECSMCYLTRRKITGDWWVRSVISSISHIYISYFATSLLELLQHITAILIMNILIWLFSESLSLMSFLFFRAARKLSTLRYYNFALSSLDPLSYYTYNFIHVYVYHMKLWKSRTTYILREFRVVSVTEFIE
jgi:hypothetical protein